MSNVYPLSARMSNYAQYRLTVSFSPGRGQRPVRGDYRLAVKPYAANWTELNTVLQGSETVIRRPQSLSDGYELFLTIAELLRWAPEISGAE